MKPLHGPDATLTSCTVGLYLACTRDSGGEKNDIFFSICNHSNDLERNEPDLLPVEWHRSDL